MDKTRRMTAAEFQNYINQNNSGGNDIEQIQRNRRSNDRGRSFENLLMKGCQYYQNRGTAAINKVYEPYICTKVLQDGKFIGRFLDRAEPDFKGVLDGGRAVAFEAKSTCKSSIQYNVLTQTQRDWLAEQAEMGALAFVAIDIQGRFFSIPYSVWADMKNIFGKKSLAAEDIAEYEVIFDGTVRFLEYESGGWLMNMEKPIPRDNILVEYVSKIIEKYRQSAMSFMSEHCDYYNYCEDEEIQALDEECCCLLNEFKMMLNRR